MLAFSLPYVTADSTSMWWALASGTGPCAGAMPPALTSYIGSTSPLHWSHHLRNMMQQAAGQAAALWTVMAHLSSCTQLSGQQRLANTSACVVHLHLQAGNFAREIGFNE